MINHVVIMSHFRHRPLTIRSLLIVQYRIIWRPHLYNQLYHYLSTAFHVRSHPDWLIMKIQFWFKCKPLVRSVASLSCLVFVINHTLLDQSSQFNFFFQHITNHHDPSCHCPVSSLSWTGHYLVGPDSSIFYSMEITTLWSVTSLSCLVFMIDRIFFNQPW